MNRVELVQRSINEYAVEVSPKLLLIADKPLANDTKEIFDSPLGFEYLSKCFKSKYKSVNTHVTYVGDETPFAYSVLFNILCHYLSLELLNPKDFSIAFVGEKAFNKFLEDIEKTEKSKDEICERLVGTRKIYVDRENNFINVFFSPMYSEFITMFYTILPDTEEVGTDVVDRLNNLKSSTERTSKVVINSPYSSTEEMISYIASLKKAYDDRCVKGIRVEGRVNPSVKRIESFTISDNFFNNSLSYCSADACCKDDDMQLKKRLATSFRELLSLMKVYGKTAAAVAQAFGVNDVSFITESEYSVVNKVEVLPPHFDIIDMTTGKSVMGNREKFIEARGIRSEWYDKWIKEVYNSTDPSELKIHKSDLPNEPRYEWIYDIEVFQHDFLLVAYSLDKRFKVVCWNDFETLEKWIANKILIGFNNAAYDDNVVKYAIARYKALKDPQVDPVEKDNLISVKKYSDLLIENEKFSHPLIMQYSPFFISWDIIFISSS